MRDRKENWFKQHKVLTVVLVLVGLMIIAGAASGGDTPKDNQKADPNTNTEADSKPKEQPKTAKVGEAVRDGKFEFVVSGIKCGETSVGQNEYVQEKAQGQFCRVSLTIKNIGDEAQSLFADNQKLVDDQGRQYSYDSTATIYAGADASSGTWYDQINPRNSVTGDILFDVPKDTKIVTAELHDSAFSGGVKVGLQ